MDAGGSCAFGAALRLLAQCIDVEVRKPTRDQKGDWRPLVFLMTDGAPTDSWESIAEDVRTRRLANVIACAAGDAADRNVLKRVSGTVVELRNLHPDTMRSFFNWVSSSIKTTSQSIAETNAVGLALPPPPPQIVIVP